MTKRRDAGRRREPARLVPVGIVALALGGCAASPHPAATGTPPRGASATPTAHLDAATSASADPDVLLAERGDALLRLARDCRTHERAVMIQLYALDEALRDVPSNTRATLQRRRDALDGGVASCEGQAIGALRQLTNDPTFARTPQQEDALVELARLLKSSGDLAGSLAAYEQLADRYPRSHRAAEAYLALAEDAFSDERLEAAIRYCDRALESPAGEKRAEALYLKSWSLRGLDDAAHPDALRQSMEALRELVGLPGLRGSAANLQHTAEQELVELYVRRGDPQGAPAFFDRVGGARGARLLTAVRNRYDKKTMR